MTAISMTAVSAAGLHSKVKHLRKSRWILESGTEFLSAFPPTQGLRNKLLPGGHPQPCQQDTGHQGDGASAAFHMSSYFKTAKKKIR